MQKVIIKAGFGYDSAIDVVRWLVDSGFSVSAQSEAQAWTIAAMRAIDPELEKQADAALRKAGIIPA